MCVNVCTNIIKQKYIYMHVYIYLYICIYIYIYIYIIYINLISNIADKEYNNSIMILMDLIYLPFILNRC